MGQVAWYKQDDDDDWKTRWLNLQWLSINLDFTVTLILMAIFQTNLGTDSRMLNHSKFCCIKILWMCEVITTSDKPALGFYRPRALLTAQLIMSNTEGTNSRFWIWDLEYNITYCRFRSVYFCLWHCCCWCYRNTVYSNLFTEELIVNLVCALYLHCLQVWHWRQIFHGMGREYDSAKQYKVEDLINFHITLYSHLIDSTMSSAIEAYAVKQRFNKIRSFWLDHAFTIEKHVLDSTQNSGLNYDTLIWTCYSCIILYPKVIQTVFTSTYLLCIMMFIRQQEMQTTCKTSAKKF